MEQNEIEWCRTEYSSTEQNRIEQMSWNEVDEEQLNQIKMN